jgi:hypothetical protein
MNMTDFALSMGITVTHIDIDKGTVTTREPNGEACTHPMDQWVHVPFEKDNGGVGDSYDCGLCGEFMQVG